MITKRRVPMSGKSSHQSNGIKSQSLSTKLLNLRKSGNYRTQRNCLCNGCTVNHVIRITALIAGILVMLMIVYLFWSIASFLVDSVYSMMTFDTTFEIPDIDVTEYQEKTMKTYKMLKNIQNIRGRNP